MALRVPLVLIGSLFLVVLEAPLCRIKATRSKAAEEGAGTEFHENHDAQSQEGEAVNLPRVGGEATNFSGEK